MLWLKILLSGGILWNLILPILKAEVGRRVDGQAGVSPLWTEASVIFVASAWTVAVAIIVIENAVKTQSIVAKSISHHMKHDPVTSAWAKLSHAPYSTWAGASKAVSAVVAIWIVFAASRELGKASTDSFDQFLRNVLMTSLGYYAVDTWVILKRRALGERGTSSMILHHLLFMAGGWAWVAYNPQVTPLLVLLSFQEASTPFLHAAWWLRKLGRGNTLLFAAVQKLLWLAFVAVRLPSLYFALEWSAAHTNSTILSLHTALPVQCWVSSAALAVLNLWWAWELTKLVWLPSSASTDAKKKRQ